MEVLAFTRYGDWRKRGGRADAVVDGASQCIQTYMHGCKTGILLTCAPSQRLISGKRRIVNYQSEPHVSNKTPKDQSTHTNRTKFPSASPVHHALVSLDMLARIYKGKGYRIHPIPSTGDACSVATHHIECQAEHMLLAHHCVTQWVIVGVP